MNEERFLTEYENLLDKGYCNCNEMNCIDNNSPRRILNIAKRLQQEKQKYKEVIDKAKELINKCVELQLENDYLMDRINLANYNMKLLDILKEVE